MSSRHDGLLPIHVEEDHHDCLRHILNAVGAKRIPLMGNVLIHLDAHPDLGIPSTLTHEVARDKSSLMDTVSIENWILPLAYLGICNTIVWVRSPWSGQMPDGIHSFHIGKDRSSGKIKVTCGLSYFISEGLTVKLEELEEAKEVQLLVTPLNPDTFHRINEFLPSSEAPILLDICLDFYSTKNPFLDIYSKSEMYDKLKDLYWFEAVPEGLTGDERLEAGISISRKREALLSELEDVFTHLDTGRSLDSYEGPVQKHIPQIESLKQVLESDYLREGGIDWLMVHNAGCTHDDTDLPHHIATEEEIRTLLSSTESLCSAMFSMESPRMITLARSALDEFCPADQVESIQVKLIERLQVMFENCSVHLDYNE